MKDCEQPRQEAVATHPRHSGRARAHLRSPTGGRLHIDELVQVEVLTAWVDVWARLSCRRSGVEPERSGMTCPKCALVPMSVLLGDRRQVRVRRNLAIPEQAQHFVYHRVQVSRASKVVVLVDDLLVP